LLAANHIEMQRSINGMAAGIWLASNALGI
jgi:hypothetical protein